MMMYRCAIREVQTKLEVLDDEFSVEYKRNPISFIKTRIKKPESIYRKLQKLGYDFTAENIQEQLNDVAGVRIVCAFIDDIYTVALTFLTFGFQVLFERLCEWETLIPKAISLLQISHLAMVCTSFSFHNGIKPIT